MKAAPDLYWIETPWRGQLAVSPRPRGGDWLEDEIAGLRAAGIDVVVSLLTPDEVLDLALEDEEFLSTSNQIRFLSLAIPDRDVPPSDTAAVDFVRLVAHELAHGRNVAIHCRQGVGRSGMIAAAVLAAGGTRPCDAFGRISRARRVNVPETEPQRLWVERVAPLLASVPAAQA